MKLHDFAIGFAPFVSTLSCQSGPVRLELCGVGWIPDAFRTKYFGPLQDLELPLPHGTDEEFHVFLKDL